ncbi:response regulator, partial [Candidatus Desantisbacteria bacterium]|nr:response regulator [Candidatus Desantisbacteria bacterium]
MKEKILIIEDDDTSRNFIYHVLEMLGYYPVPTKNAIEAIEHIIEEEPNLIILNQLLPGMNGFEICENLKNNYLTAHIPIIIVTETENRFKGLNTGADEYIV